jgi:molybdopterin/thiamine biosynthesis adenylyltransferase
MSRDRYLRQQGVEGLARERLAGLRVTLVGAGAVGNEVLKNLVLMGVGAVDVHDFDRVEIHNLTRSIFLREDDIGRGKAAAVVERAVEVDASVRLRAIEGDAWRTLRLAELATRDVVICAVDNLEARMRLSQLCLLAGVDLVNVGIDSRHASVDVFPFASATDTACFECHLPESAYRRVAERYSCGWLRRALLVEQTVATTAITASAAGALAVQAALRIGEGPRGEARRVLLDTRSGASTLATLERNPDCAGCAPLQPRPRRIAAGSDWRAAVPAGVDALQLAEALIFDYACAACGTTAARERHRGRPAAEFDDRIMRCASCGELGVRVDLRAEAGVDELVALYGRQRPPVKFLLARPGEPDAVLIDLEE